MKRNTPHILTLSLFVAYLATAAEFPPDALFSDPPSPPFPAMNPAPQSLFIDSDGDGLTNAWDEYPFDGDVKRKEPVGMRHYGLVPLTLYPYGTRIGEFTSSEIPNAEAAIALDDDHRVAWWTRETIMQVNGTDLYKTHWWSWDNNMVNDKRHVTDVQVDNDTFQTWGPSDISPYGMLTGTWMESHFSDSKARGFYAGRQGQGMVYPPGGDVERLDAWMSRISWATPNFQLYGNGTAPNGPDDTMPVRYYRSLWSGSGTFQFQTINSVGSALGVFIPYAPGQEPPPLSLPAVWSAGGIFTIGDAWEAFDFNASGVVVGVHKLSQDSQSPFFDPAEPGAIWKLSVNAQESLLHHWIPPIFRENYLSRPLKNALPLLVNNNNDIIFMANNLVNGLGGFYETGYYWINESAKTTQQSTDVQFLAFGDQGHGRRILRQNQVGTLAVADVLPIGGPELAVPCEFVTNTEDLRKGFDYPIFDDGVDSAVDQRQPTWWTSVTFTNFTNAGMDTSSHVKLRFANQDAASMFSVRVKPTSTGLLTLEQGSGSVQGTETALVIKGKPMSTPSPTVGQIEAITPNGFNLRTLNVRILPERSVPVRIIYVFEPAEGPEGFGNPTWVTLHARHTSEIIGRLNYAFKQCGVQFYDYDSGAYGFNYDGIGSYNNNKLEDSEISRFTNEQSGFERDRLTVFVVREFGVPTKLGLSLNGAPDFLPWVIVSAQAHFEDPATDNFDRDLYYHTIAHEVGHVLGINGHGIRGIPSQPANEGINTHDFGKRPLRYGKAYPLLHPVGGLRPQDYWIRSEDWVSANTIAATLE